MLSFLQALGSGHMATNSLQIWSTGRGRAPNVLLVLAHIVFRAEMKLYLKRTNRYFSYLDGLRHLLSALTQSIVLI